MISDSIFDEVISPLEKAGKRIDHVDHWPNDIDSWYGRLIVLSYFTEAATISVDLALWTSLENALVAISDNQDLLISEEFKEKVVLPVCIIFRDAYKWEQMDCQTLRMIAPGIFNDH